MKNTILITIFLLLFCTFSANAQTEQTVCISQSSANACRDALVENKAVKAELAVKTQAITDLQAEIMRLREELALKTGELIGVRQESASQREIIKALVPMLRAKKIGLINF